MRQAAESSKRSSFRQETSVPCPRYWAKDGGQTMRITILAGAISLALIPLTGNAQTPPAGNGVSAYDHDHDGTVDLNEAQQAAKAKFDGMDVHHDGKLRAGQNSSTLGERAFKKADTDHDGTVDAQEYQALVAKRFKAADQDGDGTLDAKELASPRGKSLSRLMQ
jgi:Ca2+-binding EF-hand superfamily protein